jgi:hypothetical protein
MSPTAMTDADATTEPVASRPSADPSRTAGARPRGTRGPQHRRRMFGSIRSRLLLWFCLLAGAALAASAFATPCSRGTWRIASTSS